MNTHSALVGGLDWIDPPQGVNLRDDEERVIWAQFTESRLVSDWSLSDLVQLGKIVALEYDIRKLTEELHAAEGYMIEYQDSMGRLTTKENPIVAVIDRIQKTQLSMIRSMSLNVPPSTPAVMQKARDQAQTLRSEGQEDSLLAQPHSKH